VCEGGTGSEEELEDEEAEGDVVVAGGPRRAIGESQLINRKMPTQLGARSVECVPRTVIVPKKIEVLYSVF